MDVHTVNRLQAVIHIRCLPTAKGWKAVLCVSPVSLVVGMSSVNIIDKDIRRESIKVRPMERKNGVGKP